MTRRRKVEQVFEGPELERVLAFVERQEFDVPPAAREGAIFAHLRAWASSRLPLPRGVDYPPMVPIELIRNGGGRIVGVRVNV